MKILIVIPARQHSTRIYRKNLLNVKNKSLVKIAIDIAKKQKLIFDILITSDSKKINNIAFNNNVKSVEKRNLGLSSKFSTSYMTVSSAIKWYEKKYCLIDAILLLQPTTPFRTHNFVDLCLRKFLKFNKSTISVYPYNFKQKKNLSDGSVYIIKKEVFLKTRTFDNLVSLKIRSNNYIESLDIDTYRDYEVAIKLSNLKFLNQND
jgi:CMP-N-acetylneuraminic acid synthetase